MPIRISMIGLLALAGCAYDTTTAAKGNGLHQITFHETWGGGGGNALDWQTRQSAGEVCPDGWVQVPPATREQVNGRMVYSITIKCK